MNDTQIKSAAGAAKGMIIKPATFELLRTAARGQIVPDTAQFSLEKRGNLSLFSLLFPLPAAATGDMAYFDGSVWVKLLAPPAGSILYHDSGKPVWLEAPSGESASVLTHDGTTPSWTEGKTGSIVFQDCTAAEVATIEWTAGIITTEGTQTIEAGCDGTSSSS